MTAILNSFVESRQRFEFKSIVWLNVIKYDTSDVHKAIIKYSKNVQAVDFVAIGREASPIIALIEVKDFRQAARGNPGHAELVSEVCSKVVGTLGGVVSAARGASSEFQWPVAGRRLLNAKRQLLVFLHVELAGWNDQKDAKAELNVIRMQLEQALAWIPECMVNVCSQMAPGIPNCEVSTI